MLLTDGGIHQLELWRTGIGRWFSTIVFGRPVESSESYQAEWDSASFEGNAPVSDRPSQHDLLRFRSQVQASQTSTELAGHEQRARVLALRGLSQARDGEYERAQTTFASAARLDPRLDLALLPSFWNLPRRAHDASIAALHDAGRRRDAAALTATVKTRFRPHALRAINRANDRADTQSE
jgi:hypothetical protein